MNVFSKRELRELFSYIDFTDGMSIGGTPISCFEKVYYLASSENVLSKVSTFEAEDYIKQIEIMKEAYQNFGVIDCVLFDKLILFLKNITNLKKQ